MAGKLVIAPTTALPDGVGGISTASGGSLDGWTVSEAATPSTIGQQAASTGGLSFSGTRDFGETGRFSEFLINDAATFIHDDDGSGALGEIEGIVTTVATTGSSAAGTMATDLQRLVATRQSGAVYDLTTTGSWEPDLLLPGVAQGIGRDSSGNIHVAVSGQATGTNAIYIYDRKGNFVSSWGVVGTGADAIGTIYAFTAYNGKFYVGMNQSGYKVKVYNSSYVRTLTFGATGSGNNQYQAITDLDIGSSGNIYILDNSLGRVQKINSSGTYVTEWAVAGERVSVNPTGTRVSVLNNTAKAIYTYTNVGVLSYSYVIPTVDYIVDIAWSSIYFYLTTATEVRRLVTPLNDLVPSNVVVFRGGVTAAFGTYTNYLLPGQNEPGGATLTEGNDLFIWESGTSSTATVFRFFDWLGATLSQVYEYYFWLIEDTLPIPNFAFTATNRNRLVYRAWEDSVWTKLNELASATRTEIVVINGVRTVRDLASAEQAITSWANVPTFDVSSLGTSRSIDVVYQGITNNLGLSTLLYNARDDNNRILSVTSGSAETFNLPINGTATYVEPPTAIDSLSDFLSSTFQFSWYMISAADDLPVLAAEWVAYGGSLTATAGVSYIEIVLTGPTTDIPGVPGPYKVAVSDGSSAYATLKLWGAGMVGDPATLTRHTSADPAKVTQESGTTITNYFVNSKTDAYEASTWAASYAGGPTATLNGSLPLVDCAGFGSTPGGRLENSDGKWRVVTTTLSNTNMGVGTMRHTMNSDLTDVWGSLGTLTNYVANSSFETNLTDYTASSLTTLTRSSTWAAYGTYSGRLSTTSSDGNFSIGNASVSAGIAWSLVPGHTYTVSGSVHSVFPGGGSWLAQAGVILVEYANATTNNIFLGQSDALAALTADARPSVTFTLPADATGLKVTFYATGIGTNWFAYWDGLMVNEGEYLFNFFDGANGGTWNGTANASTSYRALGDSGDFAAYWNGDPSENLKVRPLRYPAL